jgi:hypothetical protein
MPRCFLFSFLLIFFSCDHRSEKNAPAPFVDTISQVTKNETPVDSVKPPVVNDSLNEIASVLAATKQSSGMLNGVTETKAYKDFLESFDQRWQKFDSSRLNKLVGFREEELKKHLLKNPVIFYPFSGPDFLYSGTFFPEADTFVLFGLEPVGTVPDLRALSNDSLQHYFTQLKASLHAILNFSFFRTISMSTDLKNAEVDGVTPLLLVFWKKLD